MNFGRRNGQDRALWSWKLAGAYHVFSAVCEYRTQNLGSAAGTNLMLLTILIRNKTDRKAGQRVRLINDKHIMANIFNNEGTSMEKHLM